MAWIESRGWADSGKTEFVVAGIWEEICQAPFRSGGTALGV